jgi:DNA (cytosine-5)-methyltransferase 1
MTIYSPPKYRLVSLFSGCGGGDLGAMGGFNFLRSKYARHPVEVVYANDIDHPCTDTYAKNFGGHITCADIRQIPSEAIPDHEILMGGFPCQTFSIVGQRKGLEDPRGRLYFEMARILKDKKPKAFIAENVKGLMNIDDGKVLKLICKEFEKAGYKVSVALLNAADFGVPPNAFCRFLLLENE